MIVNNSKKSVVAETLEKTKTYVFAELLVRDRVLAIILKDLTLALFLCASVPRVAKSTSRPIKHPRFR